ncbi:plasmid replication protein RepB [Plesiomonas shigelloides]|uniref:Plasmid replication protein RepB n=1 Tax=Plesiomonas shigelloides TaxID=703 RepID=A0A8I1WAL9_PLESH|nr:plasmid replication protein RepB [Plesiomonas shigelloides]MBO1110220.1 plasmid replication protein RepB [Plesiomonas shigelloides]
MEVQKAKWLFYQGGFSKALGVPTPVGSGDHLQLVQFGKGAETSVLERQRGGWRVFKTIDAAVSTAKTIGFRRIAVDLTSL